MDSWRITLKGNCQPACSLSYHCCDSGRHSGRLGASAPEKVSQPGSSSRSCVWMAASHAEVKGLTFRLFSYTYHFLFLGCSFPLFTCCMSARQFFKASLRPSFCPLSPDHSGGGRSPCVCSPGLTLSDLCHGYILLVPAIVASAVTLPVLCGLDFDPLHSTAVTSFV